MSEQKTAYHIVEEHCRSKQTSVNEIIQLECKDAHPYQWQAIAEGVCDRLINSDTFEYQMQTAIGVPPMIVITRYLKILPTQ